MTHAVGICRACRNCQYKRAGGQCYRRNVWAKAEYARRLMLQYRRHCGADERHDNREKREVDEKFHSRYSVKSKTYRYIINNSENGTAIYRGLEYHVPMKLDYEKMNEAIKYFIGEHDFKAFKASGTSSKSSVRTIYDAKIYQNGDKIYIELTGNGFLYNMVRIIAGTLVDVGTGKIQPEYIEKIIESKDRSLAGKTLQPNGLYLLEVNYE